MNKKNIDRALRSWRSLNIVLPILTEEEIQKAIETETEQHAPRKSIIIRLHQKLTTLKKNRERKELLEK